MVFSQAGMGRVRDSLHVLDLAVGHLALNVCAAPLQNPRHPQPTYKQPVPHAHCHLATPLHHPTWHTGP
jgi:hypothetical protein